MLYFCLFLVDFPHSPSLGGPELLDFEDVSFQIDGSVVLGLWIAENHQLLLPDLADIWAEGQEVLGPLDLLLQLEQDVVVGDGGLEDELPWEEEVLHLIALAKTSALPRVEAEVVVELPGPPAVEVVGGSEHEIGGDEGTAPLAKLGKPPRLEGEGSDVAVELFVHVLFGDLEELVIADDHLVGYIPAFGGRDGRKVHFLFF